MCKGIAEWLAITLTDAIGENVVGTSGNDTFKAVLGKAGAAADSTLNLADVIDGKEGTDTLQLTISDTATAPVAGISISNVEVIDVNVGIAAAGTQILNSATFAGVQQLWQTDKVAAAGAAGNYDDVTVAAGVTAGFASTGAKATANDVGATGAGVVVDGTTATQKTLDVALNGVANAYLLFGTGTSKAVETLNISGSLAPVTTPTIELDDTGGATGVKTINLAMSTKATLDLNTAGTFAALKTVNMAGSTGAITADLTGVAGTLKTVTGGSGADMLKVDLEAGVTGVKVDAGAGADTVELAGTGASADDTATVTLGAGKDTLLVTAAANVAAVTGAAPTTVAELTEALITVTDFKTSEDVLDLAGVGQALTTTQLTNAKNAADLLAATKLVAGYVAPGAAAVFSYGDDAYVFVDTVADGTVSTGDGLIKLAGVDATQFTNVQNGNLVL